MQIYQGVLKDTRKRSEKKKDFNAKELLVSSVPLFRQIKSISEAKNGVLRDQNGSGSCVTQALSKAIEMSLKKQGFSDDVISALYPYQNRSNRPQSGSIPTEMCQFTRDNGFYLEKDVVSQRMSDTQLDNFKIANDILKKQGYKLYYFLDNTPEFEEVAQYVEEYGNTMLLIDCDYNGYVKDIPTPNSRNHQVRHEVCIVDDITLKGIKYLVMDDSWGIFGDSELAKRGQRLITREAFYKMVEQVIVIRILKDVKEDIDYSKYTNLPKMQFRDRGIQLLMLQEMLKEGGYLNRDIDTVNYDRYGNKYGYYGTITNNAVLKWQLANIKSVSQAQLKAWGGKYWGNASNKRVKELATGLVSSETINYNIDMQDIKFRWDKFGTIALSALLVFIATNLGEINWTTAGLSSALIALVQFIAQAMVKEFSKG